MNRLEQRPESFPRQLPAPRLVKTRSISAGRACLPPVLGFVPTILRVQRYRKKRDFGNCNSKKQVLVLSRLQQSSDGGAATLPFCCDNDSVLQLICFMRQAAFKWIFSSATEMNDLWERDFIFYTSEMLLKSNELETSPSPTAALTNRQ